MQFTKDKRCAFGQANVPLISADFRTFPADFRALPADFRAFPVSTFWLRKLQAHKSGKEAVTYRRRMT